MPDGNIDILLKTPPSKNSVLGSSAATTPTGNQAASSSLNGAVHGSGISATSSILPGSSAVRAVLETTAAPNSSPVNMPTSAKDEEIASFPGRKLSPSESGLVRGGMGRGVIANQPPSTSSHTSGIVVPSNITLGNVSSASEVTKRNIMGVEERAGSGIVQSVVSPLSNRLALPTTAKVSDGTTMVDPTSVSDAAAIGGRVFSPTVVSSMQWRPGSSFQNPNEGV